MTTANDIGEVALFDPELSDEAIRRVATTATCVLLREPAQPFHAHRVVKTPPYREIRDDFDRLSAVIVDARRAGIARFSLAGLDHHEVDFAAVLEVGFAVELHVFLAWLFEDLQPTSVSIYAQRGIFADVCEVFFAQRGVPTSRSMVYTPAPVATRRLPQVARAAKMARQWFASERRVYAAVHRQTSAVLEELERREIAVATPRLNAIFGLGLRRLSAADLPAAHRMVERLRAFGLQRLDGTMLEAWRSLIAHFERRLPTTLKDLETSLTGLDLLQPDLLLAPAWGGVVAHAFRAWARSNRRPFAVIQHGFNIGSFPCARTRSVDADIFYAWSKQFAAGWIDPNWNEHVDIVTAGNPEHDGVIRRPPTAGQTVMLAPAGVLEFGRPALLEFWESAFAMIRERPHVRWKLRPHRHGKNDAWIRAQGQSVGAIWSRDAEPNLSDALADVDILVTMVSSVAVDAMVRGILVVLVNHLGETPLYLPDMCAGYVTDRREAAAVVDNLLSSPAARSAAYARQQGVVDQFATSNVITNIAADIAHRLPH